ncbi:MAG: hypothetical protein ACTHU0_09975 [Kofleriaceae bacterium]
MALVAVAIGSGTHEAHSGTGNSPGWAMKAERNSDAHCLVSVGYGSLKNECSYHVNMHGMLPTGSVGWYQGRAVVQGPLGANSWCQMITINGQGSAVTFGPIVPTSTASSTTGWNILELGEHYVWLWASLTFRCFLEPGGVLNGYGTHSGHEL